ncbi:unnamed protein product [Notodromas monacha]|uniref:Uncharacterized protein n=1 Tax=Notodromas monacha TaxID=399045 RepID=A0A7R9BH46_9CRUS|nr:unnamed protein product [Notodromas monacha]CAG0914012.1 unnamed protein product [Notodromas monacha]
MEPEVGEHYNLKWNLHHTETIRAFENHRVCGSLVDVILFCDGKEIKAHKLVLSACSLYFEKLFRITDSSRQPVLIFHDVAEDLLRLAVEFMYNGEVEVPSEKLPQFINLAESLDIKGLRTREEDRNGSPLVEELAGDEAVMAVQSPVDEAEEDVRAPRPKKRRVNSHSTRSGAKTQQTSRKATPSSPVNVKKESPPWQDESKGNESQKTRTRRTSPSSEKKQKRDLSAQLIINNTHDVLDLGDDGESDGTKFSLYNIELDHPQHVPPDITVEGPSPELNGLFKGRDLNGRLVYLCGFCSYTASKKTHGIDHVRIHLGDRPFACSICGRKFTRKQHMRKHEFLHQVKQESLQLAEFSCDSPVDSPSDEVADENARVKQYGDGCKREFFESGDEDAKSDHESSNEDSRDEHEFTPNENSSITLE